MSKFDNLAKLLVNGAVLTLVSQSHGGQDQVTVEVGRELLVNGDVANGKVTYIIATPLGAHELGDRQLVIADEDDLTVSKDGFTLTQVVPQTGEKLVRKYEVRQPAAGTFAHEVPAGAAPEGDAQGAVDPAPAAALATEVVEEPGKKTK